MSSSLLHATAASTAVSSNNVASTRVCDDDDIPALEHVGRYSAPIVVEDSDTESETEPESDSDATVAYEASAASDSPSFDINRLASVDELDFPGLNNPDYVYDECECFSDLDYGYDSSDDEDDSAESYTPAAASAVHIESDSDDADVDMADDRDQVFLPPSPVLVRQAMLPPPGRRSFHYFSTCNGIVMAKDPRDAQVPQPQLAEIIRDKFGLGDDPCFDVFRVKALQHAAVPESEEFDIDDADDDVEDADEAFFLGHLPPTSSSSSSSKRIKLY